MRQGCSPHPLALKGGVDCHPAQLRAGERRGEGGWHSVERHRADQLRPEIATEVSGPVFTISRVVDSRILITRAKNLASKVEEGLCSNEADFEIGGREHEGERYYLS